MFTTFTLAIAKIISAKVNVVNTHHHHQDPKRSAVAFRRCDLSPKRTVFCQLQSVGHWYSRVPADLVDPSDGRAATSAFPIRRWSGTVLGLVEINIAIILQQHSSVRQKKSSLDMNVQCK